MSLIKKATVLFFFIGLSLATFLLAQKAERPAQIIYLSGGRLIDCVGENVIEDSLVIIEGDKITYAGQNKPLKRTQGGQIIDCSGKTLLPGLFDSHIHLGAASTYGYIPIDTKRSLSGFLYSGVTSIFDLGNVADLTLGLRDSEKSGEILSPRIFAVGPLFTCPKGHGTEYGVPMALTPTTEEEAREAVRKLIPKKPDQIKIIYDKGSKRFPSLSYELMETITDEAHKNNFKVITHAITLEQAKDAIRAGTDGLAHIVGDREVDEEFLQEMKNKNVFCIPTMTVFEAFSGSLLSSQKFLEWPLVRKGVCREIVEDLKAKSKLEQFSKSAPFWKESTSIVRTNLKKMADAGIKLALGTDAGNPIVFFGPSVHRELELMVESGLTPMGALMAATKNAAEILEQDDKLGTIEPGKFADIIVVEGNPLEDISHTQNIFMTIKNGEIFEREELAREINPPQKSKPSREAKDKETRKGLTSEDIDRELNQKIQEAKSKLQEGLNTWNLELLKKARDLFLNLLIKDKEENIYLYYYVALCDYRISTFYFTSGSLKEAETYTKEGQKYLEKAIEEDPEFGELHALYATLLGYEIAFQPEKAMTLGMKSFEYIAKALQKDPDNPRINLLKGASLLFTPAEYGGGADNAFEFLNKAVNLFDKENVTDPVKPSWGKEEAYTFLGMAYIQKKEFDKAREYLKKALEINPAYGLAQEELNKIEKK